MGGVVSSSALIWSPLVSWIERAVAVARQGVPYKSSLCDSPICHPFLFVHLGNIEEVTTLFQYLHTTLESASLIFCQNVAELTLPVWLGWFWEHQAGSHRARSTWKILLQCPPAPRRLSVLVGGAALLTLPGWFSLVVYLFVMFSLLLKS